MTQDFKMTQEDMDTLMNASAPQMYIIANGVGPASPQETANDAWCDLGKRMGFDGMTAKPNGKGPLCFSAEPIILA